MTNRNPIEPASFEEDETPTERIWKQREEELQQKYQAAFDALYWETLEETKYREAGRLEDAARAHEKVIAANERINAIVAMQKQAHAAAFRHSVGKTYRRMKAAQVRH